MKRKINIYSDDFKLMIVKEYLGTHITYNGLMQKYGMGGNNNITRWMREFGVERPSKVEVNVPEAMQEEKEKSTYVRELEAKLAKAEKALEHERLSVLALNTLIDTAERELKISIRKKL